MASVLADIERLIRPGTAIPKPESEGNSVVKRLWGTRRGQPALVYSMPNHKNPAAPHEKGVNKPEWVQAAKHLAVAGNFTRSWFNEAMRECKDEGDCNFTTIGGVFELLGYAVYERPAVYRKRPEYEGED